MGHPRVSPENLCFRFGSDLMNRASASFASSVRFSPAILLRRFCAYPSRLSTDGAGCLVVRRERSRGSGSLGAAGVGVSVVQLKEDWLRSISCPFPEEENGRPSGRLGVDEAGKCTGMQWVVGIDPDASGALALLKGDEAQVFDTPHLKVVVGKTLRKRLDARSIVQLLQSLGAPLGTSAYIEQSLPFPKDGKQGWWSGGYTYGLWTGILVATGFSVVPVPSRTWKDHFDLQNPSGKDNSREAAIALFPSLRSQLKRKKDHGRAEALLIAAYGKALCKDLNTTANGKICQ